MMNKVQIAHFSDIHVALRPEADDMNLNRFFSWMNWTLSRKRKHDLQRLEWTLDRLLNIRPDIILITGDLAHTGLDAEIRTASSMLKKISGRGIPILILGGNHDMYDRPKNQLGLFRRIQQEYRLDVDVDENGLCQFNGLTLLLLEQWIRNPFYMGRGNMRLELLESISRRVKEKDISRINLAAGHFPIVNASNKKFSFRDRLKHGNDLRRFLEWHRIELYLCGHCHTSFSTQLFAGCTQYCAGSITEGGVLRTFQFEDGRLLNTQTYHPESPDF